MPDSALTAEQFEILTAGCTHPVVICCQAYRFSELAIDLQGEGAVRCPTCATDLTPLVLQHVAACRNFGGHDSSPAVAESWH